MTKITIDPVTRLEGHLAVKLEIEDGRIAKAYSSGEMFRGFETILKGRSPLDAPQITQRICGVCPISHGTASILALEDAFGATPPRNGRVLRNLILGANYIQSHILHFYMLAALDFIDITAVLSYQGKDLSLLDLKGWVKTQIDSKAVIPAAPFLPRYEGEYAADAEINLSALKNYLKALEMRALAHRMVAIFSGKAPHATTIVPGGVTEKVTAMALASYQGILGQIQAFIESAYLPDVLGVAQAFPEYFKQGRGCGNFLAFGVFPQKEEGGDQFLPAGVLKQGEMGTVDLSKITEDVSCSKFNSPSGLHPSQGKTEPSPGKTGAYSWLKAPRYEGQPFEVGPLARFLVAYSQNHEKVKPLVDSFLTQTGLGLEDLASVMGRHAARALECKLIADELGNWLDELNPDQPVCNEFDIPQTGSGVGLTEAPRGALGHWLTISDQKIENYQCVVPSTWNCSPRDDQGKPGPVEQALKDVYIANSDNPIEAARVIRSFDPCLACAVH